MIKEQNFISAVVYVENVGDETMKFFKTLNETLDSKFKQYEIIAVNEAASLENKTALKKFAENINAPLTVIDMSLKQSHEQCMNAGLDISIGDYVYEFDSTEMPYPVELIWESYETAMKGNDIVTVCPKNMSGWSKSFYKLFNTYSDSKYALRSDAFRVVSRRAINRAHAMNDNLLYRKAAYAACGLKAAELEFDGRTASKNEQKFSLAIDSLILYTNFGYKFSLGLTFIMIFITIVELIYAVVIWVTGTPIQGWTTTMLVITVGMTGIFAIMAIITKYLSLILKFVFQKQNYLIENIDKY